MLFWAERSCHGPVAQVFQLMRDKQLPMVIDADGLYIVTKNLDLVKGYPHAILTPNKNEYQRLADALGVDTDQVSRSHQWLPQNCISTLYTCILGWQGAV